MAYWGPSIATIGGAKYSCQRASTLAKTAEPADAGDERLMGCVSGIELQGADRERREIIGQRRPVGACGRRISGPPDTAVDSPDIENARIGRMRRKGLNRSDHLVVGGDVFDLPIQSRA